MLGTKVSHINIRKCINTELVNEASFKEGNIILVPVIDEALVLVLASYNKIVF